VKSEDESDQATGDDLASDDDEVIDFEDVKMENNG
jgi:hypothetical protein